MHTNNASLEAFSLCINKEHTMQYAIAGAASVRPFNPILSVQHSRKNILTGADFKQPRMKSLLEKLWDILKQQGRP